MIDPTALFVTWTTYGTWLPGDERGYVSDTLPSDGGFRAKENRVGTPYARDHAWTRRRARSLQKWPSVWLAKPQAVVVADSLVDAATKRNWMLIRVAVMANHVHVLVAGCPMDDPTARRVLKGNAQAGLSRAIGESRRWWTAGGSDRCRSGEESIQETTRYIANQVGKLCEVVENRVFET